MWGYDPKRTWGGRKSQNEAILNVPMTDAFFRLDARELHHLGPLCGFVGDEFSVIGRRHWYWHATEFRLGAS